jgi:DNA-binding MarR family transcriptional regulator
LSALLEIQPITLLRQIDRLEKAGLIERRAHPSDRRAPAVVSDAAFATAAEKDSSDQEAPRGRTR